MKSLKVIAAVLLFCGTGYAESKNPYASNVTAPAKKLKSARTGGKRKSNYDSIETVTVSGQVYGLGKFNARFDTRKNVTWSSTIARDGNEVADTNTPTLLQGTVSVGGSWKIGRNVFPAAASVIGNTATFEFPGKVKGSRGSRQRMYRVKFVVGSDNTRRARVSSVPSSAFQNRTCETLGHSHNGAHAHASTVSPIASAAANETARVATISTVADPAWYAMFGEQSNAEIAAIINKVDAIYSRQMGVRFRIVKQHVYADAASSPFTTDIAGELLGQFVKNPANPTIMGTDAATFNNDVDLKHLFTGGELYKDATRTSVTTGLAFTSSVCYSPDFAYGVTKRTMLTDVTFAHEVGHNLGATHDPSDPNGIMYTYIRPNSYFSQTSVDQINGHLAAQGACLSTEELPVNLYDSKLTIARTQTKRSKVAKIEGSLTTSQGAPIAGVEVTIFIGAKSVSVTTDETGAYRYDLNRRQIKGRIAVLRAETAGGEAKTTEFLTVTKA